MPTINRNEQLMVGADPEFSVKNANGEDFGYSGYVNINNSFGNLGTDCGCAEIRPSPGSPRQVTENIGALLREAMKGRYSDTILLAGGGRDWGTCLGGHIHFNVHWNNDNEKNRLLKLLDRFIGIPLKAMPGGLRNGTNSGGSYGSLGSYDTKEYGFEYRTPPSWLTDPGLTEAVLSVGYLITDKWLKDASFELDRDVACTELELSTLVPEGPFKNHWDRQVKLYAEYIFGNFNLASEDMRERWLAPALIEYKRGTPMVDLLVGFRERVAAKLAERRRLEEEARLAREERARQDALLVAQRRQAQAVQATVSATTAQARETVIWGRLRDQQHPAIDTRSKEYSRYFPTRIFLHRNPGGLHTVEEQSNHLRVGFVKILQHDDGFQSWHGHSIYTARGRRIRTIDSNTVYMSSDLKHLVKRSRNLGFKIKFVDISGPQGTSKRTVWFRNGEGRRLNDILRLLLNTKRRIARGSYGLEDLVGNI